MRPTLTLLPLLLFLLPTLAFPTTTSPPPTHPLTPRTTTTFLTHRSWHLIYRTLHLTLAFTDAGLSVAKTAYTLENMLEVVIRAAATTAGVTPRPEKNYVPVAFGKLEIVFASVRPIPWGDLAEYASVLLGCEGVVGGGLWEGVGINLKTGQEIWTSLRVKAG